MDTRKRLVVVGAGMWGQNLIRVFSDMGVLVGVCDPNRERVNNCLERVKKRGVIKVMEWQEVLNDDNIDAVVLAVPVALHYRMTMQTLSSGKHVWLEKPMVLSLAEAEEIVRVMDEKSLLVMVDHLMRYHPGVEKMLALIDEGLVGKLWRIETCRKGFGRIFEDADSFYDLMPHDLSVVMAMLKDAGEIVDFSANVGSFLGKYDSKNWDWAESLLVYQNGACVSMSVSRLHPIKEQRMIVMGEKGALLFDDRKDKAKQLFYINHRIENNRGIPSLFEGEGEYLKVATSEPLKNAGEHFIDCISESKPCRTSALEALQGLRVLDKIAQTIYQRDRIK